MYVRERATAAEGRQGWLSGDGDMVGGIRSGAVIAVTVTYTTRETIIDRSTQIHNSSGSIKNRDVPVSKRNKTS